MELLEEARISQESLRTHAERIRLVREGLSGTSLRICTELMGSELFHRIMDVDSESLERYFDTERLPRNVSELVLDVICLYVKTSEIFGSKESAIAWLNSSIEALDGHSPIDISDTFEGRRWIRELLDKIECGEFS